MTRYFEVIGRDGPARRGRLRLERPINTPALISKDRIVSAGSLWGFGSVEEAMKAADGHIDKEEALNIFTELAKACIKEGLIVALGVAQTKA